MPFSPTLQQPLPGQHHGAGCLEEKSLHSCYTFPTADEVGGQQPGSSFRGLCGLRRSILGPSAALLEFSAWSDGKSPGLRSDRPEFRVQFSHLSVVWCFSKP